MLKECSQNHSWQTLAKESLVSARTFLRSKNIQVAFNGDPQFHFKIPETQVSSFFFCAISKRENFIVIYSIISIRESSSEQH